MECNSYPDRLDLKDVYLRMCKERAVKVVISTDAHTTTNLAFLRYGVTMARRGWLEKKNVINTLRCDELLAGQLIYHIPLDPKNTRLNSSHVESLYAVFRLNNIL